MSFSRIVLVLALIASLCSFVVPAAYACADEQQVFSLVVPQQQHARQFVVAQHHRQQVVLLQQNHGHHAQKQVLLLQQNHGHHAQKQVLVVKEQKQRRGFSLNSRSRSSRSVERSRSVLRN